MKKIILLFIFLSSPTIATFAKSKSKLRSYQFFKKEAKFEKKPYRYNQYEDIISGSLALFIGNIGYFTTESKSLKLTYSLAQTIGFLNIGKGVYNYYRPQIHNEQYKMLKNYKKMSRPKTIEYFSRSIIKNIALEERAKRFSILYTSSLLTIQYLININGDKLRGKENKELNKTYYFLSGVNAIISGYSYFYKGKYEGHYFNNKKKSKSKSITFTPFILPVEQATGFFLNLSY